MATVGDVAGGIEGLLRDMLEASKPESASVQTFEETGLGARGRGLLIGLTDGVYVLVDITVAKTPPWEMN